MYIAPTDIFHAFVTNGISVHSAGIMFILAWKSLLGWMVYWTVLTGSDPFLCVLSVKLCLVKCYTGHFRRGIASQLPSQLCLKKDVNSEITRHCNSPSYSTAAFPIQNEDRRQSYLDQSYSEDLFVVGGRVREAIHILARQAWVLSAVLSFSGPHLLHVWNCDDNTCLDRLLNCERDNICEVLGSVPQLGAAIYYY